MNASRAGERVRRSSCAGLTRRTPARSQVQKRSGPINQKVHLRTRKQLQPFGTAQIDEGEERQAWLHSTKPLPVLRFTGSGGALICSSRFASAVIVPFFLIFPRLLTVLIRSIELRPLCVSVLNALARQVSRLTSSGPPRGRRAACVRDRGERGR